MHSLFNQFELTHKNVLKISLHDQESSFSLLTAVIKSMEEHAGETAMWVG